MAFLSWDASALAQGAVSLPAGAIAVYQGTECGQVKGTWVPGRILNNGKFLQIGADLKTLQRKLKASRNPAVRKKLKRQIAALRKSITQRETTCALLGSGLIASSGPQTADPGAASIDWSFDLTQTSLAVGQEALFFCAANGALDSVWGSDTYTKDSSVCNAAVHAGAISRQYGGNVKVRVKDGLTLYLGSLRNQIESLTYGNYSVSYSFVNPATGAEALSTSPLVISWNYRPTTLRSFQGTLFTFICHANGSIGSLWGTGTYTDDSSLCTAAAHSGKISLLKGGQVRIRMTPGLGSYAGSKRGRIASNSYGSWSGSFTVE